MKSIKFKNYFNWALMLTLLIVSCSPDEDEPEIIDTTPVNKSPIIENQTFDVSESIGGFAAVATIEASDPDGDELQFTLETDIDLGINFKTGVISTRSKPIFDFETDSSLQVIVQVRDTKGAIDSATITFNVVDVDDGPLTNYEKSFLSEYIYLTYKLSPTASGGSLSEKWQGSIRLFVEGDLPSDYEETLEGYLNEFRAFITDGTTIELVESKDDSNVHLIMGPTGSVANVWPDMHSLISGQTFGGYALYNTNIENYIYDGRIWMGYDNEGLFKHEFGHIIGLGHTSDQYCEDEVTSVMCPGAAQQFNTFDSEIIRILYHSDTPVGLNQNEMRTLVTELLENGDVSL